MFRRAILTLILSAAQAVVALPATAQLHHHHQITRSWVPGSRMPPRPMGNAGGQQVEWWLPLVEAIPTLLFLLGATPGIIANRKDIPNWKSYFWRGLFFGFFFFPIVLVLLYQVLKYEPAPITNQAQIRPPNIAVPQTARSDGGHAAADIPHPVSFEAESDQ
jgi:hypothetical protein